MIKFHKNNFIENKIIKKISEKIFINFKIKFICFVLAVIMYLTVSLFLQRVVKTYSIKYKIENLKDYFVIVNDLPETIKIYATDKPEIFDKITEEDFNVRIDLSNAKGPGQQIYKIKWNIPSMMRSLFSSIRIEPSEILVRVDTIAEKNVKIILGDTMGKAADGFTDKRITIDPPFARIQGPSSIINKINSVKTETINIEGVQESFRRQVNLYAESSKVKIFGKADIFVEIAEKTDVITFRYNEISFQNLKSQFKASLKNEITVKLTGAKKDITALNKNDISLYIDCASIAFPGEFTYLVHIKKPENFTVISIIPEEVKILVEDKK
jgi:YbbR domain-containing protein